MKPLLTLTAIFEAMAGLGMMAVPSLLVSILVGGALGEPAAIILGRITGVALFSLALACWFSRNNEGALPILKVMLFYNISAAMVLLYAGIFVGLSGAGLWPAVFAHLGLAVWCIVSLRKTHLME